MIHHFGDVSPELYSKGSELGNNPEEKLNRKHQGLKLPNRIFLKKKGMGYPSSSQRERFRYITIPTATSMTTTTPITIKIPPGMGIWGNEKLHPDISVFWRASASL
jgi:hypothetical protein